MTLAVRHCSWQDEFLDLRMRKEKLCSGKSEGECRCDLLAIPWRYIFIAEVGMGRFIEPCWIEMQLMEGERPFWESRRPHVTKWESGGWTQRVANSLGFYVFIQFQAVDLKIHLLQFCLAIITQKLAQKRDQLKTVARSHSQRVIESQSLNNINLFKMKIG